MFGILQQCSSPKLLFNYVRNSSYSPTKNRYRALLFFNDLQYVSVLVDLALLRCIKDSKYAQLPRRVDFMGRNFLFYTDLYFLIFGNVMWQNVVG